MTRPDARIAWLLAVLLLATGLAVSRPLVSHWTTALPLSARATEAGHVFTHASGDTLQLYYQLWLARDGVLGPTPFLTDPYQFRVNGPRWNLPQAFLPLSVPFTLLSGLGLYAAYNLLVLLTFPAAGVAAYLLVRHYTADTTAALAAGAAFAVLPMRLHPLFGGHPAGFAAPLVPLVLWGLDGALCRNDRRLAVAGGAAFLALATLEPQYTYLVAVLVAVYAPVRWLGGRPRPGSALLVLGAFGAAGAGWLLLMRQTLLVGSVAAGGRRLDEVRLFSPGPSALLAPETYGGLVPIALAVFGLVAPHRRADRVVRAFFGVTLALALVLSLGPRLPWLPLYEAAHRWVPLFALIRNPAKLGILVGLAVVVLAGYGVFRLAAWLSPRGRRWAPVLVPLAVLATTAPWHGIEVTRQPDNPMYATLRAEAARVLYLPVWPGESAWSSRYLHHVTRTRVPMVNGYSPLVPRQYVADVFGPLQGLNAGDLGPAEQAVLRRLGVTHLVLDRGAFPPQVSPFPSAFTRDRLAASPGLVLEGGANPLLVYRMTEHPVVAPVPASSPVGVFYEAEAQFSQTGRADEAFGASGGRARLARAGLDRPGFLTFGPYRSFPAGSYRATFRVRGAGLVAEITTHDGRRVLAARPVRPAPDWHEAMLAFTLDRADRIELRLRWDGHEDAAADWVQVVFADRPDPEWAFEAEALPHRLLEGPAAEASGGSDVRADPRETPTTRVLVGPSRLFPPGAYRLHWRAKVDRAVPGPLLELQVTEPSGRILARRTIGGGALPPGGYEDIALDFALDRPTVLDFPVNYQGGATVRLDRLTVTPRR